MSLSKDVGRMCLTGKQAFRQFFLSKDMWPGGIRDKEHFGGETSKAEV